MWAHGQLKGLFSSVQFSCSIVSDSATPWIAAHQASLSCLCNLFLLCKVYYPMQWKAWGQQSAYLVRGRYGDKQAIILTFSKLQIGQPYFEDYFCCCSVYPSLSTAIFPCFNVVLLSWFLLGRTEGSEALLCFSLGFQYSQVELLLSRPPTVSRNEFGRLHAGSKDCCC